MAAWAELGGISELIYKVLQRRGSCRVWVFGVIEVERRRGDKWVPQTKGEIYLLLLLSKQRMWNESGCWRVSFRRLRKGSAGGGKQGVEGVVVGLGAGAEYLLSAAPLPQRRSRRVGFTSILGC